MIVKANKNFESVIDVIVNRPRQDGEVFEVAEERGNILLAHNLVSIVEDKMEKVAEIVEKKKPRPRKAKK